MAGSIYKPIKRNVNTEFEETFWNNSKYKPSGINVLVCFKECLPDFEGSSVPRLLIRDDMMLSKDDENNDLFTRRCHHGNNSAFLINQNIFHQRKVRTFVLMCIMDSQIVTYSLVTIK